MAAKSVTVVHPLKLRNIVWFVVLLVVSQQVSAAPQQLSDQSRISVITASPGAELYTAFGHTAIRVRDPRLGIDSVYNYGTFDFSDPAFYWQFTRGELRYYLSRWEFHTFRKVYRAAHRSLFEQMLRLTLQQRQALYNYLEENYRPENRYYWYDSFLNNCSTKVRDALVDVFGNHLIFADSLFTPSVSFREAIRPYLSGSPWGSLGINLLLGSPVDRNATYQEMMFLPYELKDAFASSMIQEAGHQTTLVQSMSTYPAPASEAGYGIWLTQPAVIFWLLAMLIFGLTLRETRYRSFLQYVDSILFGLTGLLGVFLLFMWVGTIRPWTAANWNLLWALPTHLPAAILLARGWRTRALSSYFLGSALIVVVAIGLWHFLPQALPSSILPLLLLISLRAARVYQYGSK